MKRPNESLTNHSFSGMKISDIVIGMVGSGGDGVVVIGDILTGAAASEGLFCMQVKSFGPQIRGGESLCTVRISQKPVYSQGDFLNVLLAFNWGDYKKFPGELHLNKDVTVISDKGVVSGEAPLNGGIKPKEAFDIPFDELAKKVGSPRSKNMVALGVLAGLFGLPKDNLKKSIARRFGKKRPEVVEENVRAFEVGMGFVSENNLKSDLQFSYTAGSPKCIATGNDALAFGALTAGCRFFASYPITPASEIMEWMGRELPKFNGTMVQAEDEISAACMVTGASFGGVKAMTATSGPGLSLKIETIGLGTMAELPYVVVNVQRGGPATGIPTKTEQADLMQAIYGMHGDAPHAVIAPADVSDCFDAAIQAFNIAEGYQMPVIILSDQFIGHRKEAVEKFDTKKFKIVSRKTPEKPIRGKYARFAMTDGGVSPMSYPGIAGGEYTCVGIEHDEVGHPVSSHVAHEMMVAKRAKKLDDLAKKYKFIRRYGSQNPDVGIITWGSTKGIVRDVVEKLEADGFKAGALVPQLLYPLQADVINDFIRSCKKIAVVEMSHSGQFGSYLASRCEMPRDIIHIKSSGAIFFDTEMVLKEIKKYLRK